jgi:hypothetical protein
VERCQVDVLAGCWGGFWELSELVSAGVVWSNIRIDLEHRVVFGSASESLADRLGDWAKKRPPGWGGPFVG